MLAGYIGSHPNEERWLQALQRSAPAGSLQMLAVPGGGLLAPRLSSGPDGTATALLGESTGCAQSTELEALGELVRRGGPAVLCGLDGQWALAQIQPGGQGLILAHDPFGAYGVYYAQDASRLWFSTSLSSLLAVPEVRRARRLDLQAVHSYLVFSYVPAPSTLLRNVRCVPPFMALTFDHPGSSPRTTATFLLPDSEERLGEEITWQVELRDRFLQALERRAGGRHQELAVALSGGVDSAAVAVGLTHLGHQVIGFHLRFARSEGQEQDYAEAVASHLHVPLRIVTVIPEARDVEASFRSVVRHMAQPYGDPVTLPLWLLYRDASDEGLRICFNGEGGDQLFAGWPNKAMFAAEVYGAGSSEGGYDRVEAYLRTFHHFYGEEDGLYEPELRAAAVETDLRSEVAPYLEEARLSDLFARLRWTNYRTKGSQNIMPRAASLARAHGLTAQAPLFDLDLARYALTIPGPLLQKGTSEKDLFKKAVHELLPLEIPLRRKRGMGVPATQWVAGPLRCFMRDTVVRGLGRRGLVRRRRLEELMQGRLAPGEVRTRRVGEQLWQLAVLELWLQIHLDSP